MPDVEPLAVLTATAAAFVAGGEYYAVAGDRLESTDAGMPPWKLAAEVLRCLVLAAVVAGVAAAAEADWWAAGLGLGLALWVGFPLVLWTGAIIHENTPVRLAAVHAGDWLVKLLLVGVIVGVVQ